MKFFTVVVLGILLVAVADKLMGVDLYKIYGFTRACFHDVTQMFWGAAIVWSLRKKS